MRVLDLACGEGRHAIAAALLGAQVVGLDRDEARLSTARELGWGPNSDDHLLRPGELARLIAPLRILHGREALEPVDAERWRAVASAVGRRD
jgi:SAM-dependent methyltransferase